MMRLTLSALALSAALAFPALAQETEAPALPAMLVADRVFVDGNDRLIATGHVEALQGSTRLVAERIVYDQSTGTLSIEGPIRVTENGTEVIITADQAELDQGLQNGLMMGARMVLDQQLQLASVQAHRVNGRYTQLSKVAVTSCQVCGANQTPLWQIRASRVIHDQEGQQLYFDHAQLRVLDIPIAYLPRLRLPDPTLKRARGVLTPSVHSSTLLGFGLKVPYFIPFGDHQDLTLTPFLATNSRSLEFRYRRAFHTGEIEVNGAVSRDEIQRDKTRGYLHAVGGFDIPSDFRLNFDLKTTTDDTYLDDYNIDEADRLASTLLVSRVRTNERISMDLRHFRSLRSDEDNETQPSILAGARYERRFAFSGLAGEFEFKGETQAIYRVSTLDVDGSDTDSDIDGRDLSRANAELSWSNRWTLPLGLRAGVSTHLWLDHFNIAQDSTAPSTVSSLTPGVAVELRWPFAGSFGGSGRTLIEPIVQYGWVGGERAQNPNEESTRVDFDEGNLLSLTRFPGPDRREHGQQLAAGLRWRHIGTDGWASSLTLGRVWHETADPAFSLSSGLQNTTSDWLVSGGLSAPFGLSLQARGLFGGSGASKAEARATWSNARLDLGASYLLQLQDPAEDRTQTQSEWSLDGSYRMTDHWTSSSLARYDIADQRLDRLGLGLQYQNECVQVEFKATRKYASSTLLEPSTDFNLTVALKGFSTGGSAKEYRRTCGS